MRKVKKSNDYRTSVKVTTLFSTDMRVVTTEWLTTQQYSNDELLEILKISKTIKKQFSEKQFYIRLILSYTEPVSNEVFNAFTEELFNIDALIHLLKHASDITDVEKQKWIKYAFYAASRWYIRPFFLNDESKAWGLSIYQHPYNIAVASKLVTNIISMMTTDYYSDDAKLLWALLNSMADSKKLEWYDTTIGTYSNVALMSQVLTAYPDATAEMLTKGYYQLTEVDFKRLIVTHPNCPPTLKLDMYATYGDATYLSPYVQNLFVF